MGSVRGRELPWFVIASARGGGAAVEVPRAMRTCVADLSPGAGLASSPLPDPVSLPLPWSPATASCTSV
ncbi:hypothetical protein E2562_010930 [Oryza meyeriana var. granulata]|uniref:Uncharacterized protein n=1 Tax=Oryza meyeriana var. granulata TaxID=110450 RepID=A0A6G1BV49_9ORYZ|nr:hypothetical protein E2562_010930 [Oryza meyeriana var. granulata]